LVRRFVGGFATPSERQTIVSVSRNNVDVCVKDLLSCDDTVRLDDVETVELEDRFERTSNAVNGLKHFPDERCWHFDRGLVVWLRNDERMAAGRRFDVEESQRMLVFVQSIRGRILGDDRTERTL